MGVLCDYLKHKQGSKIRCFHLFMWSMENFKLNLNEAKWFGDSGYQTSNWR